MTDAIGAAQYVLDASAMMALLKQETGADYVGDRTGSSIVSAVNLAEVASKLAEYGMPNDTIEQSLVSFTQVAEPFDAPQAMTAGFLRAITRTKGLSLGDRACLALAKSTGRIALTADRAWVDLDIGIEIELIR